MSSSNAYLFVDGTASPKDFIGAWAALAVSGEFQKLIYGIDYPTTISRCELRPIIEGLRWIKNNWALGENYKITVFSDSEYTVKTLNNLYRREKNIDLWCGLDAIVTSIPELNVKFIWRERNTLPQITLCDEFCKYLRQQVLDNMSKLFTDIIVPEKDLPKMDISEAEYVS